MKPQLNTPTTTVSKRSGETCKCGAPRLQLKVIIWFLFNGVGAKLDNLHSEVRQYLQNEFLANPNADEEKRILVRLALKLPLLSVIFEGRRASDLDRVLIDFDNL